MRTKFIALCVEDDDDTRLLFRHVVGGLGGVLIEATNVDDGWAFIRDHRPHLVILDLSLPGQSGWTIVDRMHEDSRFRKIPIVVVSIKDQAEEQYHGRHIDWVHDYITKPFGMAELEAAIKKAIEL